MVCNALREMGVKFLRTCLNIKENKCKILKNSKVTLVILKKYLDKLTKVKPKGFSQKTKRKNFMIFKAISYTLFWGSLWFLA